MVAAEECAAGQPVGLMGGGWGELEVVEAVIWGVEVDPTAQETAAPR